MNIKAKIKFTIKYLLNICEAVGNFTFGAALSVGKAVKRFGAFVKKSAAPLAAKGKSVGTAFFDAMAEIMRKSKKHAAKYGFVSGVYKFRREIKKACSKNRETILRVVNYAAPALAVVVIMFVATSFSNVTLAFEVKCAGETVGYISNEAVLDEAANIVNDQLEGDGKEITTEPNMNIKLVSADKLTDADELSEAIIETSGAVTSGYGIYVDGEFCAASEDEQVINSVLQGIKDKALKSTSADIAEFMCKVEIEQGLFFDAQLYSESEIVAVLDSKTLPVKTVGSKTEKSEIKYETVEAKDNTKYAGYKRVSVKGENGIKETVTEIVYVNGKQQSSRVVDSTVIKEPVDEQIIVGTRELSTGSVSVDAKYAWPVERVSRSYVSCYYGSGGHTGVDICAPVGTQIYAAQSGVVTEIINKTTGYGYYFVVDCGNGIKNKYAHCSEIDVAVGDTVTMGQPIAKVGNTGNSTGPHLHFEVIKNGTIISPAPYLGIN